MMFPYVALLWCISLIFVFYKGYAYHDSSAQIKILRAENQRLIISQRYYKEISNIASEINKKAMDANKTNEAITDELRKDNKENTVQIVSNDNCNNVAVLRGDWLSRLDTTK